MGLLLNIVAAEEDEADDIAASTHPLSEWSGIEAREIGPSKLAMLHGLLTGDSFDDALEAYEHVLAEGGDGAIVVRFPEEPRLRLAELDEDSLEEVGAELAASEEFEDEGWPIAEVQDFVFGLGELARVADSQGQELFIWMHPLLT